MSCKDSMTSYASLKELQRSILGLERLRILSRPEKETKDTLTKSKQFLLVTIPRLPTHGEVRYIQRNDESIRNRYCERGNARVSQERV